MAGTLFRCEWWQVARASVGRPAEWSPSPLPALRAPPRKAHGTSVAARLFGPTVLLSGSGATILSLSERRPRFHCCYFFHSINYQPSASPGILQSPAFSIPEHHCENPPCRPASTGRQRFVLATTTNYTHATLSLANTSKANLSHDICP